MNPPKNAIVVYIDEKTRIQALEKRQPVLPVFRNVPERQSKDYIRHGTTTLFAALDVLNGHVIAECTATHTQTDYTTFLKKVDKAYEKDIVLHIVTDNVSSHKTKAGNEYLESIHGRFKIHFTPTYSSWLNVVER